MTGVYSRRINSQHKLAYQVLPSVSTVEVLYMWPLYESLNCLHPRIVRPTTTFRRDPVDVLGRVFDVAGLAVHAVLRVDLQRIVTRWRFDVLVYACWAVARLRPCVVLEVDGHWHAGVF